MLLGSRSRSRTSSLFSLNHDHILQKKTMKTNFYSHRLPPAPLASFSSSSWMSTLASSSSMKDYPSYVTNAPATLCSTLNNGLRVASEEGFGTTATVGVWIHAGSRHECEKTNGSAHFLEHMAFKGTSRRTQTQLEMEIENLGGHLNAYTSREQTVYYAKVMQEHVPQAMDLIADILQHSLLDPQAMERERDVILREYQEVQKQTEEVVFDDLHETAFPHNGLGRTILGPIENVKNLTQDDLKHFIDTHYTAPRMVVAGAGAVQHDQLVELSESLFGSLPSENKVSGAPESKATFIGADKRTKNDELPVAHLALAFEGCSWTSEMAFPLLIMQTLLGQWDRTSSVGTNMSSKLGQVVAEQELAHSFHTFNTCYDDTGLFGVYAVADKYKLQDLTWYTLEAMVRLVHNTTEEEVQRAKTQLKASLLMQLDGSSPVCEDIGRQFLTYGRRLTPAEIFARIDAVDVGAVKMAADKVINDKDHALSAIGPIHELPDYNFIRRRSYWLRN